MSKNTEVVQPASHKTSAIPDSKKTRKKAWSKWLKFLGGALLLSAFGMQMWENSQSALATERIHAAELDSRTLQKAIGYETLYFSAKATGVDNPQFLMLAAREYFTGSIAMITTAQGDKNEKARKIRELEKLAADVRDIASLDAFIALDNRVEVEGHANEMAGLTEPDTNAKLLAGFYLILYVIGSVTALIGQALD
jgi:hypothetical protein